MELSMPPPQIYIEKTLAIIKPDIVDKEEEIQDIILRSGFTIVQQCHVSLRAIYGTDDLRNALHGSNNFAAAEREIRFMFPEVIVEPIPVGQSARDYLNSYVMPTLLEGLTELCKRKPADPFTWLADWLLENNPNKPKLCHRTTTEEPY
ncbi:PREDICTED: nucleoside diphosphate kinase homolog 5 [Chrysochloris asiatica]|uniref:Nucleoside diphosphate kinase homolog 5 n=1 Tax=Chrysochloris asiatica TaxID=185453 RepID=A0A9B0WTE1_CHRAS|nr:PREDICTED: nucleoside diphosphate kinase homolog 5 [Chrysochloris asiatica]